MWNTHSETWIYYKLSKNLQRYPTRGTAAFLVFYGNCMLNRIVVLTTHMLFRPLECHFLPVVAPIHRKKHLVLGSFNLRPTLNLP